MGFRGRPLARPRADDLRAVYRLRRRHERGDRFGRVVEDGYGSLSAEQHLQRRHLRRPSGDSGLGPSGLRRPGMEAGPRGSGSLVRSDGADDARHPSHARDQTRRGAFVRRYGLCVRLRREYVGIVPAENFGRAGHEGRDAARRTAQGQRPRRDAQHRHLLRSDAGTGLPDRLLYAQGRRRRPSRPTSTITASGGSRCAPTAR